MRRVMASGAAGVLAYSIGRALHVPVWRDWEIGDCRDMAIAAFALVWWLTLPTPEPERGIE